MIGLIRKNYGKMGPFLVIQGQIIKSLGNLDFLK